MTRLLVTLALVGCAAPLGVAYPTQPTLLAWQADGFPLGECADLELRLRVLYSYPQLRRECRVPPSWRAVWACSRSEVSGFAGSNVYWLMRVIGNDPVHPLDKLIAHESTHAVASCGLRAADPDHLNKRLWNHYDKAQQRAVRGFEEHAREVQR